MTTEQHLDNIDARLDRLVTLNEQALTRQDHVDEKLDRIADKLESLSDQVGRMTEGLTHLQLIVQEQSETSKRQEANISRLVGIVEALIQQK